MAIVDSKIRRASGSRAVVVCRQLAAMFNTWLNSDSTVNGNVASLTSSHLQQLGHIVCGATPTQISGISPSVYRYCANQP